MKRIVKYCGLGAFLAGASFCFPSCDGPTEPEYDGVWEVVPTPKCLGAVSDIYFVNSNYGWAVAGWGYVWHYDGNNWKKVHEFKSSAPENDVAAVTIWFENESEGWAAGHELTPSREYHTKIWRYESATWSEVTCPDAGWVSRIWFNSPNDGWLIGGEYALRYDGSKWYKTDFFSLYWKDCFFENENDGWATSKHGIYKWDGLEWVRVKDVDTDLECIGLATPTKGWAMGYESGWSFGDVAWRYDGSNWTKENQICPFENLDVHFLNANFGWAGGISTFQWNGEKWTRYDKPLGAGGRLFMVHSVFCVSESDVWMGGTEGNIIHFKGFGARS